MPDPDDLPIEELIERAEAIATGSMVESTSDRPERGAGKGAGGKGKGGGGGSGGGGGGRHAGGGKSGGLGKGAGKGAAAGQKSDKGRRKVRCKVCKGCLAEDCDACVYCMDKPKNGGNNTIRQACIHRRCLNPQFPT